MKRLATELTVQNRSLRQIKREGRVALYELYGANGMLYDFEVVRIKIHPAEVINGRTYPEREGYPSNEDWGNLAWSHGRNHRDEAFECFHKCLSSARGVVPKNDLIAAEGNHSGLAI